MVDTWLTAEEVQELTSRKRWTAQCRALADMHIQFTPNAAGRPLVPRQSVIPGPKPKPRAMPNWEALSGKTPQA